MKTFLSIDRPALDSPSAAQATQSIIVKCSVWMRKKNAFQILFCGFRKVEASSAKTLYIDIRSCRGILNGFDVYNMAS